jgi:hypothetical protein
MADNFGFDPGSTSVGAADDIDGVLYPRVKIALGANNTNDGDVASGNPMPVSLPAATVTTLTPPAAITGFATSAKQDTLIAATDGVETLLGTIDADTSKIPSQGQALAAASMPVVLPEAQITTLTPPAAISGFATSAKQDTMIGHLDGVESTLTTIDGRVDGVEALLTTIDADTSKIPALGQALAAASVPVVLTDAQQTALTPQTDGLTDTELRATPVPVSGSVTVDMGANNDVTVTSGAITETNSGAIKTAVEVIDNAISGTEMQVDIVAALPAGTNGIGKLTANSGVDIGDVDVTSVPSCLQGAGNPTVDSYANAVISASANTANQSLIAAPGASKQIWVYGINFSVGTGAGSASFQDEDDTAISGVMPFAENGGMVVAPTGNFAMPLWKVATNKALEVDTVTCDIKGSIQYAIISV